MEKWHIFQGSGKPQDKIIPIPEAPHWRRFTGEPQDRNLKQSDSQMARRFGQGASGKTAFQANEKVKDMVNVALLLRRPLLIEGKPGTGKSTLAHAVAYELQLGPVLIWPITSRATVKDALYQYDALNRLQDASLLDPAQKEGLDIGEYIRLGPLGTALLPSTRPRVLLIDEIDKCDIDLPNDLLTLLEDGEYEVPELMRAASKQPEVEVLPHDANDDQERITIQKGTVCCHEFPFIIITSNGERELPAPFLRRCLRLNIQVPELDELTEIVEAHFGEASQGEVKARQDLIHKFLQRRDEGRGHLATDQLLNAIYLTQQKNVELEPLLDDILKEI